MAEERSGPHDPWADRTHGGVEACRLRPGQRRSRSHAVNITVEARPNRDRGLHEAPLFQRSDGVGERNGQRSARQLEIGGTNPFPDPGADGNHLAVQRAADDRHAPQSPDEPFRLLRVCDRVLERCVRQLHHVRARLRGQLETAREVHMEDVEAARAETKLPRLDVHDHVVALLDLPGHPRVRDTRLTVDLAADQLGQPLDDRRHASPPKRERHRGARGRRRPSPRRRRRRCARRACESRPWRSRA